MKDQFWMLYAEDGRAPTYRHGTAASAKAEAERLARMQPGKPIYMLRAEYAVTSPSPSVQWERCQIDSMDLAPDDIPF